MIASHEIPSCTPIIVATHMRSGTHLCMDLLRRQFLECRATKWPLERNDRVYVPVDVLLKLDSSPGWTESKLIQVLSKCSHPVCKVHWTEPGFENLTALQPHLVDWFKDKAVVIYVVRDPAKVLLSMAAWDRVSLNPKLHSSNIDDWLDQAVKAWLRTRYRLDLQRGSSGRPIRGPGGKVGNLS